MHFREEEQYEEVQAQNTDKKDVMSGLEKSRTGRRSTSLIRGGDERCQTDEISRKGKGKGNGGKGEHGGKGDNGGKGFQQIVKVLKDEEEEDKRVQVAPNMGAGGSYSQAMMDAAEGKTAKEEKKRMQRPRWADCDDNEEEKEGRQEEQEAEREKENQEAQKEEEREEEVKGEEGTRQEEMPDETPPGLEASVVSEHEVKEEEQRRAQKVREERRAQEARETKR